jgi:1-acyl-sn-glycerol-3-phosphate acyltransferase
MDGGGAMWPAERIWRLFATGFLYLVFGIGSILLAVFVALPLWVVFSARPELKVRIWRKVIQKSFAAFVRLAGWLRVLSVSFHGVERLSAKGQLIIANHPSLLDVVILMSVLPDVDCVIKRQLSRNPFVAFQVYMADYVRNDSAEDIVYECSRRLDAGRRLIIFPEGTRTRRGQPLRFLRGTARIILACNAPLRPVLVYCRPHTLAKGDAWFRIPETRIRYVIDVRPCLDVTTYRALELPMSVNARQLTRYLESWFGDHLVGDDVV